MKTLFFAAIMFGSAAFAGQGDPGAAARYKAKFGRDITRQQQKSEMMCNSDCCRHQHQKPAA